MVTIHYVGGGNSSGVTCEFANESWLIRKFCKHITVLDDKISCDEIWASYRPSFDDYAKGHCKRCAQTKGWVW